MTNPTPPRVDCERVDPGLAVSDVPAAVDFYTNTLGFTLGFTWGDPPTFAGVNLGDVSVHLMEGTPSPGGSAVYFVVGDVEELYAYHRANGVEIAQEPGDREYGLRDYMVRDLYGYTLGFGQHIYTVGEPIPIERVEVPVRLEKRLAALLHDLAAHKRMSLSSCLEEILLHTNEPLGDGVASPHSKAQLRYIQELKRKHGIDYDSHGSYRFVEAAGAGDAEGLPGG
ncbi:MAG TPA: VOC family protein [Longimicrobium sp.]|nr:VOC family protein [Longimicrobium sp.]